ncbi:MAG: hypothetical protein Q9217_005619 [Psora testacea]
MACSTQINSCSYKAAVPMSDKKLEPIDLSHHYSKTTKNRIRSNIKDFYKYFSIPGIGNLAGGLPNNNNFPFDTLEAAAALPARFVPTPNQPVDPPRDQPAATSLPESAPASRVLVPKSSESEDILRKIDLKSALQYGTAQGYPPLYSYLRQFTRENMHPNVPYGGGPDIILTCGSTDGFAKSLEALSNTWSEGDPIHMREGMLVEEFAYMNAIQAARPRGLNIVPVAVDEEGMCPEGPHGLLDVLENWDTGKGKRPHLMYTVTIGQNPTSSTLGVCRRKAIYALCVKYDVIIIEDDPYWYLQYPSVNASSLQNRFHPTSNNARPGDPYHYPYYSPTGLSMPYRHNPTALLESSGYEFLDSLVPSYLSVDYEGRVVRLDTFSKTVAPGCRLGWITTQPALCERLLRITETSTQQPSGFVQSIIAELIMGPQNKNGKGGSKDEKGWQTDGWVRWLEGLRGNYERRMNTMCFILEEGKEIVKAGRRKSLSAERGEDEWSVIEKTQLYDFAWPRGGMFIWLHLRFETHPLYKKVEQHERLAKALFIHLTTPQYRVLASPGTIFAATDEIKEEKGWQYFRLCFAAVDEDLLAGLSRKLVAGIHSFWGFKNVDDVEELVLRDVDPSAGDLTDMTGIAC